MSLPPLIPNIPDQLEKYLTDPSDLPIHRTEPAIKVWERVPNLKRELQVEHGPLSTTIQVERDLKTGDVKGRNIFKIFPFLGPHSHFHFFQL